MAKRADYIAVFDSGVGGISVLRQLRRLMPEEHYLYFGDSANAPYGCRPTGEIRSLTMAAAARLFEQHAVKALVVACNTATAAAIQALREAYPDRIIVGIEPALKLAADACPGGNIGVMATQVTLQEEKFDTLLHRFTEKCTVSKIPAPGLVELIEAGRKDEPETEVFLRHLLRPYEGKLDALVLGCTHYPFVSPIISRILPGTQLLDGGEGTARETKRRLAELELLSDGPGSVTILNSSQDPDLMALSQRLLEE